MTDFIENIEQGVRYTDCELENTAILLNIDCPICGKHDVYAKSYVVNNPVLVEDTTVCTAVIGCAFCSEQMTYYVDPDLPMKDHQLHPE